MSRCGARRATARGCRRCWRRRAPPRSSSCRPPGWRCSTPPRPTPPPGPTWASVCGAEALEPRTSRGAVSAASRRSHALGARAGAGCGVSGAATLLLQLGTDETLPLPAAAKQRAVAAALRLADAVAALAVPAAPHGVGRAVPSPEEHAVPRDTRWQAGWMQGASGVGSFLLHAHAVAAGRPAGRRMPWPDEPWR